MFSYISNLIKLFGKSQFDVLRREKGLTFFDIENNNQELSDRLSENTFMLAFNKNE